MYNKLSTSTTSAKPVKIGMQHVCFRHTRNRTPKMLLKVIPRIAICKLSLWIVPNLSHHVLVLWRNQWEVCYFILCPGRRTIWNKNSFYAWEHMGIDVAFSSFSPHAGLMAKCPILRARLSVRLRSGGQSLNLFGPQSLWFGPCRPNRPKPNFMHETNVEDNNFCLYSHALHIIIKGRIMCKCFGSISVLET